MNIGAATTCARPHRRAVDPGGPGRRPSGGAAASGRVRPLGLGEVTGLGGFWGQRQQVNAAASLAHCEQLDGAGWLAGQFRPRRGRHHRSEPDGLGVRRLRGLQAAGGTGLGSRAHRQRVAEAAISRLTARIAPAQDEDGYLGTAFGHPGQPARYTDLEMGHELYNIGHLLQAAVARLRTVGEDELVRVARRAADHVCAAFGPDGRQKSAVTRRSRWV